MLDIVATFGKVSTKSDQAQMQGAPVRAIQELAGHQHLSTTQRYMHLSPAAIEGAIRVLEQRSSVALRGDIVETAIAEERKVNG